MFDGNIELNTHIHNNFHTRPTYNNVRLNFAWLILSPSINCYYISKNVLRFTIIREPRFGHPCTIILLCPLSMNITICVFYIYDCLEMHIWQLCAIRSPAFYPVSLFSPSWVICLMFLVDKFNMWQPKDLG